ncbi:MAG TPA: response regulator transcription factor [Syntrophales bacterium]|nr:response regulator transcription factor [Syntrophales bacterium]HON99014.1 response regulator transcription factor [Syntrophales bacterium]HPC00976.1 response regulator transcription factor [Syntrophales bacterium]HPQ05605.1 response regulator transcription factor [Syntrophales bacterium]HRS86077.1 response regulator transcription factor [Syntrophales bacterium]
MRKIRVLIADDHAVVRDGLRQIIDAEADLGVVAEAQDGAEALEAAKAARPDVTVLDISMPVLGGLELIGLVRSSVPETKIVILTMYAKESFVYQALSQGALGYVLKASPRMDILEAIRAAHRGEYFLSSGIRAEVIGRYLRNREKSPAPRGYDLLTEREQQVFRLVVEGNTTGQIADILCVSAKTVEKHRLAVMNKLGIHDRLELLKYAIKIGIVDPDLWGG